jgi:DNA-binding response OmpR family regulator
VTAKGIPQGSGVPALQMAGRTILLVDDDAELGAMLTAYLDAEGFATQHVRSGAEALSWLTAARFDIVLLDVMMPNMDGMEVLRRLRLERTTPVLMLTARGDEQDRILGFTLGADDYLPKPFSARELVGRVRAILRRTEGAAAQSGEPLAVGPLSIDPRKMTASLDGAPVRLTTAEFMVLESLMRSAGKVQSREALSYQALGRPLAAYDRSIDTHVSNIRRKLRIGGPGVVDIRGFRGLGYVLSAGEGPP